MGRYQAKKLGRDPVADIMLCDLCCEDLQAWIGRQTVSAGSINRELTLIGSLLKAARIEWNWMAENPMLDLKKPKQPPGRDRIISEKELERLLLALGHVLNLAVPYKSAVN